MVEELSDQIMRHLARQLQIPRSRLVNLTARVGGHDHQYVSIMNPDWRTVGRIDIYHDGRVDVWGGRQQPVRLLLQQPDLLQRLAQQITEALEFDQQAE